MSKKLKYALIFPFYTACVVFTLSIATDYFLLEEAANIGETFTVSIGGGVLFGIWSCWRGWYENVEELEGG